jgi:hypothetical protein
MPGTYRLVVQHCAFDRAPVLTTDYFEVDMDGAKRDLYFPSLELVPVQGRVEGPNGQGLSGMTVRFNATKLLSYEDTDYTYTLTLEAVTINGNYDTRLLPGNYDLEFLPEQAEDPADDWTPSSLRQLEVSSGTAPGTVIPTHTIEPFKDLAFLVVDNTGAPIPNSRIACTERDFAQRSWSATADEVAQIELPLPNTSLVCEVTPPGDRLDLSLTRTEVFPAEDPSPTLTLLPGTPVLGRVDLAGIPEAFALVEVYDGNDTLVGRSVSSENGSFQVNVLLETP